VQRILELMDSPLQPVVLGQAQHEIKNQYLYAAKARQVLNWQPLFTMQGGLRRSIDWYRDYFGDRKIA
jgi:CDP-glucose 4,6-dehydratase